MKPSRVAIMAVEPLAARDAVEKQPFLNNRDTK
jgi:hypothetical protein